MTKNEALTSKKKVYISVTLTNDQEIKELNKKYLNREHTTDVLSFGIGEETDDGTHYLGDIVVNVEQAKKQAKDYDNTFEQEIADLVAHGVLHLLGVHHKDDDEISIHGISVKK